MNENNIKKKVRESYGKVALRNDPTPEKGTCVTTMTCGCCGPAGCGEDKNRVTSLCCTGISTHISRTIGYSDEDLAHIPEGSNAGLGCGNPVALASLKEGEVVLDLGSGLGIDCFLAAKLAGETGKVIGVDMTPEMIEKAREHAREGNYTNVEFRLGEIETLPVADNSVDLIISNCVINLVPNKEKAFQEAFRVLKPGGRMMISDIVLLEELPESIRQSVEAYVGCLSGAVLKETYLEMIENSGFINIDIQKETSLSMDLVANDPTAQKIMEYSHISREEAEDIFVSVLSLSVRGEKPPA
jgi:SAM-dependent methyltransferase